MSAKPIPARVRAIVLARAGGVCEVCGREARLELHHRKYRSRGGAHSASNLVALCGWGNHTGCHGWAHTEALAVDWGVSLHSWDDHETARLWSPRLGAWIVLDDNGGHCPA